MKRFNDTAATMTSQERAWVMFKFAIRQADSMLHAGTYDLEEHMQVEDALVEAVGFESFNEFLDELDRHWD
jgi:cell division protein YceG involved in septum cleavage